MIWGVQKFFSYIFSVAKVLCLFLFVLALPRLFLQKKNSYLYAVGIKPHAQFKLGLENIPADLESRLHVKDKKKIQFGLITNQTGIDQYGRRNIDILVNKGLNIAYVFSPEHGISGTIHTDDPITNSKDKKTNIPILSLYSAGQPKSLSNKKILDQLDALIFDMQGSGMRHYTYISTLFEAIDTAEKYNKSIIVLDRPNLLGPIMEGPLVEKDLISFVSYAPIPLRHGMTVGELASYYNAHIAKKSVDLHVIPMQYYERNNQKQNKMLTMLSPGIRDMRSCQLYSFLGMLGEVRPFDVGLKTDKPFQYIALPETIEFPQENWQKLHMLLTTHGVESSFYRYFSEKRKNYCSGLLLNIKNINTTSSFTILLATLQFFKKNGVELNFSKLFDNCIGTDKVRLFLENKIDQATLVDYVNKKVHKFFNKSSAHFIYKPFPQPKYLAKSN